MQTKNYQAAAQTFRGDWDENGTTSVHLPRHIAEQLLTNAGWHPITKRGELAGWESPDRSFRSWYTDEALQRELAAQALGQD